MKIITGYLTCTIFTGIVSQNYQRKMNAALSIGACISNKPFVFSSDLNIYISMAKRQGKVSFNGSFAYKHFSPLTLSSVTERLKGRKLWVLSGLSSSYSSSPPSLQEAPFASHPEQPNEAGVLRLVGRGGHSC